MLPRRAGWRVAGVARRISDKSSLINRICDTEAGWGGALEGERHADYLFRSLGRPGTIEDLVALGGDPVTGAANAITADASLALARIYRAYLSLYGTTAEGAAEASELINPLEAAEAGPLPEREAHHLAAARAWADGDWQAATRNLERALVANPRDLLALKVAQDLYFFLGNRLELRDVAARVLSTTGTRS